MTLYEQKVLMRRFVEEVRRCEQFDEIELPVVVTPQVAVCVIANLQLALRHPENDGDVARVAKGMIEGLTRMLRMIGLHAHADLAEVGNDPANDLRLKDYGVKLQ